MLEIIDNNHKICLYIITVIIFILIYNGLPKLPKELHVCCSLWKLWTFYTNYIICCQIMVRINYFDFTFDSFVVIVTSQDF